MSLGVILSTREDETAMPATLFYYDLACDKRSVIIIQGLSTTIQARTYRSKRGQSCGDTPCRVE